MLTIDRVTQMTGPNEVPAYSPYGHVIAPDGTCYALIHQWYHGVVLALLRPDLLANFELREPNYQHDDEGNLLGETRKLVMPDSDDDINVFQFQEFELAQNGNHEFIRFCPTRVVSPPSVDLPYCACPSPQHETLRSLFIETMGFSLRRPVAMSHKDVSVATCLRLALLNKEQR